MAPLRFLLCLLVLLPVAARAQAPLPVVHVLATGGTISNTEGDRLTGEALVKSLPGVERVARVTVEQFSNTASGNITLEQWRGMALRIEELYRTRPELAGVVVTHGTDTMEETAYFLDLAVAGCRPVIVTGAMRRATAIGADGPANLYNSIRLGADPRARALGSVVLMNDAIFEARSAAKINTSRVEAFAAPDGGPLGMADPDTIVFYRDPADDGCARPAFDLSAVTALPRVDVVYSYLGADGALIRAAVEAGAKGIVVAGVGRGGSTPGQREAIEAALDRGVAVVMSNRTGSGRVPIGREGPDPQRPGRGASFGADDLNPQKARVLLMLALTRTQDPAELAEIFRTY